MYTVTLKTTGKRPISRHLMMNECIGLGEDHAYHTPHIYNMHRQTHSRTHTHAQTK
jgi:hypothetical protein